MKITADTITDEQIRELQREALGSSSIAQEVRRHIADALRAEEDARYRGGRYNARAYCAGIINARAEGK